VTIVSIGAGQSLESGAAASYARCLVGGAPAGITSAWRNPATQVALFLARYTTSRVAYTAGKYDRRVYNGVAYYRKPGQSMVAIPGMSVHEQGKAIDVPEPARSWFHTYGAEYGWIATIAAEPWHFEYRPLTDQHVGNTTLEELMPTAREIALAVLGYKNPADPNGGGNEDVYLHIRKGRWAAEAALAAVNKLTTPQPAQVDVNALANAIAAKIAPLIPTPAQIAKAVNDDAAQRMQG